MAVLQKMREKFGVAISVLIALALLYFIAPMDDLMNLFGRPQDVGEIAGRGISYEEFQSEVAKYTTLNEIMTGSSVQDEQTRTQIQNSAWQSFVDENMFIPNCKAAGIFVGKDELKDLTVGGNISPVIAQNPYFLDDNGVFSADRLVEFVQQSHEDETVKLYWDFLQNAISTQQFYTKYAALFSNSSLDNSLTLARTIAENNTTADIDVVTVSYSYAPDTTIKVSDSEIRKYYNSHKSLYRQNASRDIEYVVYEVKPSASDIQAVADKFATLQDEFASTDNVKSFIMRNSDRSYSEYWYRKGELTTVSRDIDEFAFSSAKGVSKTYQDGNVFRSAKVIAAAQVPDSIYVKHILLQGADAKDKADSLLKVVNANPSKFAALAQEFSADKGSKDGGVAGNIGWLTQTYTIPGFESLMTAKPGKAQVIKTSYGYHVVAVTKTSRPQLKKQVAVLEKNVVAGKETFASFYAQANRFATIAGGSYDGYLRAVDSLGVYSHRMNEVLESNSAYGSVDQAKEVTRWIYEAKAGKASNIITVDNKYFFVAALKAVHKEGYTPVKEVASQIRQVVYNRKRDEKQTAEVAAKIAGIESLDEVASVLGTTVNSMKDVKFSAIGAQSVEPAVLGAALDAEIGKVTGPVQGAIGTYVIKVGKRETGTFYTEEDARGYASQKSQYGSQMIIPVMLEAAEVRDDRARYY